MKKEILFRKTFCDDCIYLEDAGLDHRGKEIVYCSLPFTKDCELQDWKRHARLARKFVRAENDG